MNTGDNLLSILLKMFALGVPEVLVGSVYFERHMLGFEPMKSQTYKYSRQRDRHTIEVRKKHTGRSQLGHCWLLSVHVFWFFFFFCACGTYLQRLFWLGKRMTISAANGKRYIFCGQLKRENLILPIWNREGRIIVFTLF